jgi:hypothetical protein
MLSKNLLFFLKAFLFIFIVFINLNKTYSQASLKVIESNTNQLVLEYNSDVTKYDTIKSQTGENLYLPIIKGTYPANGKAGEPTKLIYTTNVSVPAPDAFKLEYASVRAEFQAHLKMAPNPNLIKVDDQNVLTYLPNDNLYNSKEFEGFVQLKYAGIGGNRHLATLTIIAAQWNSYLKTIQCPTNILIKISFNSQNVVNNYNKNINHNELGLSSAINFNETTLFSIPRLATKLNYDKSKANLIQSANNKAIKIEVSEEGIYKIDAATLTSLGMTITPADVVSIKMYGNGGKTLNENPLFSLSNYMKEQEIIVNTKQDGNLESIVFYGAPTKGFEIRNNIITRYHNTYSDKNYYLLTWGGQPGKRATFRPTPEGEVQNKPLTYYHKIFFEEEINNPYIKACGRSWFGRTNLSSPFIDLLPNLDVNQPILYRFALAHRSPTVGTFTIFENNNQILQMDLAAVSLDGYRHSERSIKQVTIPSSFIPSDSRSILKFQYSNPSNPTSSTPFLDYYEIHFPRSFYAIENELSFYSDTSSRGITEYSINGFTGDILGFDLSDIARPKLLENISKTNGIFVFRKNLVDSSLSRYYISAKFKTPSKLEKISLSGIEDDGDYNAILVTDKSLLNSAKKFVDYRQSKTNLKIKIVTTEEIYNELNAGMPDITAIRDYVSYAYQIWKNSVRSLILWGDGHFDYKGIQYKNLNCIPAYEAPDEDVMTYDEITESYATDDYFSCVVGNDEICDVPFGRITINTDAEGESILEKIKHYENSSSNDDWRMKVFLMADDGPSGDNSYDGNIHVNYSEELFNDHTPENFIVDKLYLVEFPYENIPGGKRKPLATQKMINTINTTSAILWNWIGHGNPQVLAHEHLFDRDINVAQMSNIDKLPFMAAATCDFGRFDDPDTKSGSEELFLSKTGGTIGVFSASRVVYGRWNAALNNYLFDKIFEINPNTNTYFNLGEIVHLVKENFYNVNDKKFLLLGDPTLTLLMPNYTAQIKTINGIDVSASDTVLHLKGLNKITISGTINNPTTNELENNFNGTAYITMYDGDFIKTAYDNVPQSSTFVFQKLGGALNRTTTKVVNGQFETSFIIPKDLSFSPNNGRIYVYAISDDNLYAHGVNRQYILDGVSTTDVADHTPPDINIFLDSRKFKNGDVVSNNPLLIVDLYDESGINTTGLGIGHLIEAWIDDNPNSLNLTDLVTSSFDKPHYSTLQIILNGLKAGEHKIVIRAWDIFNNFSLDSVNFTTLPENAGGLIKNELCIPNPFNSNGTKIQFSHNIEPPIKAKIFVYNAIGKIVRTLISQITNYSFGEVFWDGKDDFGNQLPIGPYFIRLELTNSNGKTTYSNNLKAMILR